MNGLRTVALLLVIIGALNWLLVGLFNFDLVAAITGNDFGEKNTISSIIYVLVGLAGIALLPALGERRPDVNVVDRDRADVRPR
ncbi:MAG TPA: DUF378 domain-containing protein [Trueperaceae bacterium]|nr:DUF378 domain-containing protein [Trueperaceae bacterium]